MNAIELNNFSVKYGDFTAVDNISFAAETGKIIGFVGPNGSGKSSTITNIIGLQNNYSGEIKIFGENIKNGNDYKKRIGYVPEAGELYDVLTGSEYIDFVGKLYGVDGKTIERRAMQLAESFNIAEKLNVRISQYSKGMRQKVLIISALIHNPDILLLDEPLDGLDAQSIAVFKSLLMELAKKGKTIFYSSHIMEIVEEMSENLIVINKGKIIASGTLGEIKQKLNKDGLNLAELFQELTGTLDPKEAACKLAAAITE